MDVRAVKRKLVRAPKDWNKFPDMRVSLALHFESYNFEEDLDSDDPDRCTYAKHVAAKLQDDGSCAMEAAAIEWLTRKLRLRQKKIEGGWHYKHWTLTYSDSDDYLSYYDLIGPESVEDLRWLEKRLWDVADAGDPFRIYLDDYLEVVEPRTWPCGYNGPCYTIDDAIHGSDGAWEEFYDAAEFDPNYKEKCAT